MKNRIRVISEGSRDNKGCKIQIAVMNKSFPSQHTHGDNYN